MRPSPIIWFERLALLALALGILNTGLGWDDYLGHLRTTGTIAIFLVVQAVYFAVYWLLIWLIAHRGNVVARWLFVLLVIVAALLFLFLALPPPAESPIARTILKAAQLALALVSLGFIFGPDTGPWFKGRGAPIDPDVFR